MDNWKKLIEEEMLSYNDSFDNLVQCTLTEEELLEEFNSDSGEVEGKPFTLWTETRVYFPVSYDGGEWLNSVSRYPDNIAIDHT